MLNIQSGLVEVLIKSLDGNAEKVVTIEKITDVLEIDILYNNMSATKIKHFADQKAFLTLAVKGENVIGDVSFANLAKIEFVSGDGVKNIVDSKTISITSDKNINNANYTAVVRITVGNKTAEVEIEFYYATDLRLALNNEDDKACGMERRRVFGNEFINANGDYVNTFKLKLAEESTANNLKTLYYRSSNESIATIDNQGIITFNGVGFVTITACTENSFDMTAHFISSYTFEVINGTNVYNQNDFKQIISTHNKVTVFQTDLISQEQANEVDSENKPTHKPGTYDVLSYQDADDNPNFLTSSGRESAGDQFYFIMLNQDIYGNGDELNINCYASKVYTVKQGGINKKKRMRLRILSTISNLTLSGYNFDKTKGSYTIPDDSLTGDQMGLRIWAYNNSVFRYCTIQQFNTCSLGDFYFGADNRTCHQRAA